MEEENRTFALPIVLCRGEAGVVLGVMAFAFLGLVVLIIGAVTGAWWVCAGGAGTMLLGCLWSRYQRGCRIVFEADRVTVHTLFSHRTYLYEGTQLLLRRSWTTSRRMRLAEYGLAGTAIQLRRGRRVELTVPVSRWSGRELREAVAFLEGLPNPKQYL